MNKRPRCPQCLRPPVACLCHTIKAIDNLVEIVILQHPSEVKHAKGTAKIVELSLNNCQLLIGEDFSHNDKFNAIIKNSTRQVMLLYPQDDAITPAQLTEQLSNRPGGIQLSDMTIVVLDGSWKKAYKIYCLNPGLQTLPCIGISVTDQSNYRIRKSSRSDSLSTIEACYHLLSVLEGQTHSFDSLIDSFDFMVDFQLKSMPSDVQARYKG